MDLREDDWQSGRWVGAQRIGRRCRNGVGGISLPPPPPPYQVVLEHIYDLEVELFGESLGEVLEG